jgi:mycolipenoyl-CoA---2-(long-chain-fatty acyl)-trehalose mycolipenoyltransferase / long-chain-acyl-CoA---trehalose acyltransferase
MRLTNVAQMALPPGRVRSLAPVVAGGGAPLPVSFDQGRHVGEGDRPGSWMAFAVRLPAPVDADALAAAWSAAVARHGALRSAFTRDAAGAVALESVVVSPGAWEEHPVPAGAPTRDVVRAVLDATCRPFGRPSHRLCLVEPAADAADPRPALVLASDHAHVDMWSLLVLARDLLDALAGTERPPVAAFAEHTAVLAAEPPAPDAVVTRWRDILAAAGGTMPVFPFDLGDVSAPRAEVVEVRDVLDAEGAARLEERARREGVRLIALAMSVLTDVTRRLSGRALRAVFPVHSRNDPRWHDAVGWFITNAVIECEDPSPAACAVAVREAISLGSYPLAPILAPYGGMPQGPGMFAISWLDTRRLPVAIDPGLEAQYVSAVIRTDGVMIWFIANDTGLHLRCRYPDTPEARAHVGSWLDAVQRGLVAAAEAPPGAE